MIISGQCTPEAQRAFVAAALLRLGSDTKGPRLFKETIGPTLRAWTDALDLPQRLGRLLGWPPDELAQRLAAARSETDRALAKANAAGHRLVTVAETGYPALLREIADPPLVLWHHGSAEVLGQAAVAVVGSRRAGPASLETARRLGKDLARAGLTVVSGLARGIDAAAHRGALEGGGSTIGVLGSGLDVIYPAEHAGLASEVALAGAVLTEMPPGTPPRPQHFPLRNRLISGLSRAVVVVEASERSGSLITARMALEQGRDVLAVPGSVVSGCHRGCHALIKDGARLVENVEDILEELHWARPGDPQAGGSRNTSPDSRLLASMRAGEPVSLDELAARTGHSASRILSELSQLELDGLVRRVGVGAVVRVD